MCNNRNAAVLGAGRIGFWEWKRTNAPKNQSETYICPKYNDPVSWKTCQCRERDFSSAEYGGVDCRECPHQLKLQRAKWTHKDDRKVTPTGIAIIAIIVGVIAFWGWMWGKLF